MTIKGLYIKNKGYYIDKESCTSAQLESIKKELTVKPKIIDFGPAKPDIDIEDEDEDDGSYKLYISTKSYLIVPRYYGVEHFGECPVKMSPLPINLTFKGALRDYQIPIVDKVYRYMLEKGGGLLSVPCGRGKTLMAIYLASVLKVKTLVIVHKSFLLEQWIKSIQLFTNATVGSIHGPTIDVKDKDFVIGMIQSISMKTYDDDVFKDFGLVIYDEAHHCASKVFSQSLQKLSMKYTLALSATPYRGDGLIKVLHWFLGETIYKEDTKKNDQVVVKVFSYKSSDNKFNEKKFTWGKQNGRPNVVKMLGNLVELKERTLHIVRIINEIRKDPQRKIIVLSERVAHLKELKSMVDELLEADIKTGILLRDEIRTYFYMGENNKKQRAEAEKNGDIFFATFAMAKEGLDIERLNTVILTTSQKDVNQSVGRVMRKILADGDERPLIIDFTDHYSAFINHSKERKKFFAKSQFNMENYYMINSMMVDMFDDDIHYDTITFNEQEYNKRLREALIVEKVELRKESKFEFKLENKLETKLETKLENKLEIETKTKSKSKVKVDLKKKIF
jgi:superfamily II DNA or RNA helicase